MLMLTSYKNMFSTSPDNQGGASNGFIISNLTFEDINKSACGTI